MVARILFFLFLMSTAGAAILLVRQPLVLREATTEDRKFLAEAVGSVADKHGLKDRTFTTADPRIFVMFESPGKVVGRHEGDRAVIALYFDAQDREVCDAVYRDLEGLLWRNFSYSHYHRELRTPSGLTSRNEKAEARA